MTRRKWTLLGVLVLTLLFPLITPNPSFWVSSGGCRALWIGTAALSMTYLNRNLGLMSLGHLFFSGVTGYIVAISAVNHGVKYSISVPIGILIGTLSGVLIGFIALRTQGVYFLMLTFALTLGLYAFANQAQEITHGHTGINLIPQPIMFGIDFSNDKALYYLFLIIAIALFAACTFLERTSFGVCLKGIRDNEDRMISLGYHTFPMKILAFTFSAFIASIAGVMGIYYVTNISPDSVGLLRSIDLLVVVVVGGATYLGGAFLGAALIAFFEAIIQDFTPYYVGATGVLFIVVLSLAPQGLMGIGAQFRARRSAKQETSS
jgi:branched-chain amino acid transport system permease protein